MGRRRPSVFLGVFLREVDRNTFFFFGAPRLLGGVAAVRHLVLAPSPERGGRSTSTRHCSTPSTRHCSMAWRRYRRDTSREVRRATSTKPPIPLAHALERGMLDSKRGIARRRQGSRMTLGFRGIGHPHVTTQESHGHGGVSYRVVGDIWGSNSSQPHLRAVVLAEVDVSTSVPRSEQRRQVHEQRAVARRRESQPFRVLADICTH